jgi:transcriptional regulator with XRE-family HTH domain
MTLGERMLSYRARHRISQTKLAELIGETQNVIHIIETGKHRPHKANEMRLSAKIQELEEKERKGEE